ncbi:MAG: cysteine desulfurase [Candidatus Pacebacteria bacterium CG_4_10_14_0_8_um_filter_42_14]|nr:MAG: cysteine desulfurase [Candidatus Pacebacteria bacterium CG_4_10_14_0_8_um_filter_42_14]
MLNSKRLHQDFPILTNSSQGEKLVYLDSAATSQKPQSIIDAITNYYQTSNANVHRGVHKLSDESTAIWQKSRETIASFFGAESLELILLRNTTEAINGIAYGWGDHNLLAGDIIVTTLMEHHSNFVVWQELAKRTGAKIEIVAVTENGELDLESLSEKLSLEKVKLLALTHVSNTLGTLNPITKIVRQARELNPNIRIVLDAAQSAPHLPINFKNLDVDFLAFSGHKMLGPMGSGGMLVRKELLSSGEMKPWLFGGGMIDSVAVEKTTYSSDLSERFTAGTPDVASAVGLAAACDYLNNLGMENVREHDEMLVQYALKKLIDLPELTVVGPRSNRVGSVAFLYNNVHAHDVAQILDSQNIAVRSGHHCTMPLHTAFSWPATVRASFNVYNTTEDIDALVLGLEKVKEVFRV